MRWKDIPGWFDYQDVYDYAVESVRPGGTLVEVGAWLGRSTAYLAEKVKEANRGLRFYTVDHCFGSQEHVMLRNAAGGNVATALLNNLVNCGVHDAVVPILTDSRRAAELFADLTLSFVFIDGSHDYESVKRDIKTWWPKVECGGLLAGHDYQKRWPEVIRAVDESFGSRFGSPGRHLAVVKCKNSWSIVKRDHPDQT